MSREKTKERVRKHREKLKNNPEAMEEYRRKDRERYHKNKKEGKVRPISEKSKRDQRKQRKAWRANSRKYRQRKSLQKRGEHFMEENSPDSTDTNLQQEVRDHIRKKKTNLKQRKTELALKKALAAAERYKKRYHRLKISIAKQQKGTPSPSTKVVKLLQGEKVSPPVRKRLVFCESLVAQLKRNRKLCNNETEHRQFSRCTAGKILKKYKVQNQAKPFLNSKQNMQLSSRKKRETIADALRDNIEFFFEQDDISRMLPGKKDCITRNKVKKQIRILNDTLLNLHKKFKSTQDWQISYSTFCRMRPFWVREPKHSERPTCLCVKHTNIKFVVSKLHQIGILKETRPEDICPLVCCDEKDFSCMTSTCLVCKDKKIPTTDGKDMTFFYKWVTNKLEKRTTKNGEITVKVTTKEKITCTIEELVQILNTSLPSFLEHVWRVRHQFLSIKHMKAELKQNETLIHIDYSENYECKFSEEPQSVHFGASRKQVTLHTGVLYYNDKGGDDQPNSFNTRAFPFCSLSESTRHDPAAIWAHLKPVGELLRNRFPEVDTVHFLSDGPSTQYKNKKNFFLFAMNTEQMFDVRKATWNFSAAGHGKGAADGVGGTLKRTADRLIAQGNDIPDAKTFLELLRPTCEGIHIFKLIDTKDIESVVIPNDLTTIPGTMKIHQVCWDASQPMRLKLRDASCFLCAPDKVCEHFQHNGGFWNFEDLSDTQPTTVCEPGSSKMDFLSNNIETRIVKGTWVAVIYDDAWYPGEVELVTGSHLKVNFMAKSGSRYIWPTESDHQELDVSEILCILPTPPVPVSKRHFAFEDTTFVDERLAEELAK